MNLISVLSFASLAWARGYPLFFSSFEQVGPERYLSPNVESIDTVDELLTEWLTDCKSDTFIIIKDPTPFDAADLHLMKKKAEQCATVSSFVTDYPLNLFELADDLRVHCKAQLQKIDIRSKFPVEPVLDGSRKIWYIEFDRVDDVDKSQLLQTVLQKLTSPYYTLIYSSSFQVEQPIFGQVELDPKRRHWTQHYGEHNKEAPYKKPIVAPLKKPNAGRRVLGKGEGEHIKYEIPDDTFATLFIASLGIVLFKLVSKVFF